MNRVKAIVIAIVVFVLVINLVGALIKAPEITNMNNGKVQIIGHAGSGFSYLINPWNPLPNNSLASIKKALKNGADGVEVDIQVSRDSVIVLFHDLQLQSKTALNGCVSEKYYKQLQSTYYDLGFPYDWFQNERIISLDELIHDESIVDNCNLYLDIKISEECEHNLIKEQEEKLILSLTKTLSESVKKKLNLVFISSNEQILMQLKNIFPEEQFAYDCKDKFEEAIVLAKFNGFNYLCVSANKIDIQHTSKIHENGLQVILYGGKSILGIRKILELNPDVIQVNNVKASLKLLN